MGIRDGIVVSMWNTEVLRERCEGGIKPCAVGLIHALSGVFVNTGERGNSSEQIVHLVEPHEQHVVTAKVAIRPGELGGKWNEGQWIRCSVPASPSSVQDAAESPERNNSFDDQWSWFTPSLI